MSVEAFMSTSAADVVAATGGAGFAFKNRIVNGDMRIDQRWNGNNPIISAGGTTKVLDKWQAFGTAAAGAFSVQRLTTTPPVGFSHYAQIKTTTADGAPAATSVYQFAQKIEGTYVADWGIGLAGVRLMTLSFWARASTAGTYGGSFRNGAANRSYPFTFTIASNNTWEFKVISLAVDTTGTWVNDATGTGLWVTFDIGSGSNYNGTAGAWAAVNATTTSGGRRMISTLNDTLDLTGVQVEAGGAYTGFGYRDYNSELRLCQRECWKTFNQGTAVAQNAGLNTGELTFPACRAGAAASHFQVSHPVLMRAAPGTITLYNPAAANAQVRDETAAADCTGSTTFNPTERVVGVSTTGNVSTVVGSTLRVHLLVEADL